MSNATIGKPGAALNTGVEHVIPNVIVKAAERAFRAEHTLKSRWDEFRELAVCADLTADLLKSPHRKPSTADDPAFLYAVVEEDGKLVRGERIVTTRGEVYEDAKDMARHFLPKREQALLDTPTKSLDDGKKDAKRYAQQQVGAMMSKMAKVLTPKIESDKSPSRNRSVAVRIVDSINTAKKWAQADDAPNYDVTALVRHLNDALAVATAGVPTTPEDQE